METIEVNYSTDPDTLDPEIYMYEIILLRNFRGLKINDSSVKHLSGDGDNFVIESLTNEEWEQVGHDISRSTHLESINFSDRALNDEKISFLSRGLTGSSSIIGLNLDRNFLSATGLRCMVPFLENTSRLRTLNLSGNILKSEGFNLLLHALTDSPIEHLFCDFCEVDSGIDTELVGFPKKLNHLSLHGNNLENDGCREIAKLLRRGDTALEVLNLDRNGIGDDGVAAIVDALQNNTKLMKIGLTENDISQKGQNMFLKLVNDVSGIEATLHSNQTLTSMNSGGNDFWIEIATSDDISLLTSSIDDRRNGNGTYKYPDGRSYDGEWQDGLRHGKGTLTRHDGAFYEGEWINDKMNGKGTFTWPDGRSYDGEWRDGMMNGKGTYKWPNGVSYEGEWRDRKIHGKGKKTYANGDIYDGDWKENLKDGEGKMKYYNGDTYSGEFRNNQMHGKGVFEYATGDLLKSTGEWKNGKKIGIFEEIPRPIPKLVCYDENGGIVPEVRVKVKVEGTLFDEDTIIADISPRARKRRRKRRRNRKRRKVSISPS